MRSVEFEGFSDVVECGGVEIFAFLEVVGVGVFVEEFAFVEFPGIYWFGGGFLFPGVFEYVVFDEFVEELVGVAVLFVIQELGQV